MNMQFHQALVEELRFQMMQKGVALDNETAQMALFCLPAEEDMNASVREWLKISVEDVLGHRRFGIMQQWQSDHEGESPFFQEPPEGN